jgi:hypothetical protein
MKPSSLRNGDRTLSHVEGWPLSRAFATLESVSKHMKVLLYTVFKERPTVTRVVAGCFAHRSALGQLRS